MNNLEAIYNEVEALKDYAPYWQQCDKILNMIKRLLVVDDNLLQKLWNIYYKEENEWVQLFTGASRHDWFISYRPWLQAGFEIAIKALSQEIEKQNGTN